MSEVVSKSSRKTAAVPSIHAAALPLLRHLLRDQQVLGLEESFLENGTRVLKAGMGGLEVGRRITELCMGGLGVVSLGCAASREHWPWELCVHSARPVLACLASQYAGWGLEHPLPTGGKFNALGSGPARALGSKEKLFGDLLYRDRASETCMVLESDQRPPVALAEKIASRCAVAPECLTLVLAPTCSLVGMVQVVGRVLEVALHKAHILGFPPERHCRWYWKRAPVPAVSGFPDRHGSRQRRHTVRRTGAPLCLRRRSRGAYPG